MSKPQIEITIDGNAVAGGFYERLVSVTVTDNDGTTADTFDMELNDGPPQMLAIPRKGAIVDIRLGYGSMRSLGKFTVDKVSCKCLPYSMSVSGKSADLRSGKLKERQERSWEGKKVKDIVGEIAGESGLDASIDQTIGDHTYAWFAQQDESNIHFLRRLAERHNALFAIKQGRLVFSAKGSGNSSSGAFVGSVVVSPANLIQGTCSFEANDRTKYSKVVAYYQDKDKAQRVEIEADSDAEGDSVYRIPEPFSSVEEADKAAQSKAKGLKRGEGSASVTVVGDTAIVAGAPLLFHSVRPGLDGVPYVIDTAKHSYSKGAGYRTEISAKLYDGKSGGAKGGADDAADNDAAANDSAASDKGSTPAKNAPAGTPATPNQWINNRRYGSTDAN
ncbi:phage late control D family protein [Rhizobium laguerreae]|uniref:phage late control D family protein n=1 Tax=Rhizobium laguerreae TaxID=1076926 RepID=UPI001C923FC7|nr:contractile injection system protein, VgrG/Pvc8 family [Rhizobium laguerreae]MBY3434811.1 phage late control D family protein [Rhizobium laguerreae]MBY3448954.1 phage late control D family protein [Rhizobium laguerreae]MBY3456728.1 phage late control D family protein [Rhizobium laguerreae]